MLSVGDHKLQAELENLKRNNANFLANPNAQTDYALRGAMLGLTSEMHASPHLRRQAWELNRVKERFEGSMDKKEKQNIAATLAPTLIRMTAMHLVWWGIGGVATLAVAGFLMYGIGQADMVAAYDINNDGWTDRQDFDINHDGVADQALLDVDHDHDFDTIADPHTGAVEASGTFTEWIISAFQE